MFCEVAPARGIPFREGTSASVSQHILCKLRESRNDVTGAVNWKSERLLTFPSRRSSRQMRTIRMPRGHFIDKCDLVRVSHTMLLSRTARRNLRKRGAEQTQYPWHFARPTSWQLTGDANYQDLLLADIELPNSSKIESWYNSPLQSIMLILRLDSIPFWFAYRSQAISGSLITIKGVTNIRFLVRRAHAATPAATTRWPVSTNRGQVLSPGLKQPRCKPRYNKCS